LKLTGVLLNGYVMAASTVDEFIESKVQPDHRDIVAMIRELMLKTAPNARELISYGILGY